MSSEVVLERRVERDIALVVAEKVELHLIGAGSCEVEVVERIAVRRNRGYIRHTVGVLPERRLGSKEAAKGLPVGLRRLLPIGANGIPAVAQPFLIGVTVLGDDRG